MGIRDVTLYGLGDKTLPLAALIKILEDDRIDNFREVRLSNKTTYHETSYMTMVMSRTEW